MTATSGKAVFDERVEYPLPEKQGVRDYVVYFVPAGDGYGGGARYFFEKHFKRHVHKSASSFEEMIGVLQADAAAGAVSQIRELVLVAHGTSDRLIVPLVRGTSETSSPEYRNLTARSMGLLQRDLAEGKFASFRQKRRDVVARLGEGSWVTVRACKVGGSADAMYALFSFFGGRANVYAPREFQFFGSHPIMDGMRVKTKLEAHEHLVKQHFEPHDLHTPERKDAIVQFFVDRGRFSEPFELASTRIGGPPTDEQVRYDEIVRRLNALRIDDPLRARFSAAGHPLSGHARVRVKVRDAAWSIRDGVTHEDTRATVEYDVGEEVSAAGTGQKATLLASATVASAPSAREFFPLQLFFYESQNATWKGKLAPLAGYLEQPGTQADRERLDALVAALPTGTGATPLPAAVRAAIEEEAGVEVSAGARVRLLARPADGLRPTVWAVENGTRYVLRLEHPRTAQDVQGHSLSLYDGLEGKEHLQREYELMAYLGEDPDTPGTELPAYLDRFTIDELVGLIDHLRSPYRTANSYYIHHAQQAIKRKSNYFEWSQARREANPDVLGLAADPYESLVRSEAEDKQLLAYDFDFNGIWQEVKASHRSLTPVQNDLFAEEDLLDKLDLDLPDRASLETLDPDSPYTDLAELRRLEAQGFERYFEVEKTTFDAVEAESQSCEELRTVLSRWRELQGEQPEEIKRLLELETTADGKSYADHIHVLYEGFEILKMGVELYDMTALEEGIIPRLASHIPVLGVPTGLASSSAFVAFLEFLPAITIPLELWLKTAEAEAEADQVSENTGKLTAIRQWLRELIEQSSSDDFPDHVVIDLGVPGSSAPHMARYFEEQMDESQSFVVFPFIYDPDRAKKGFDDGVRLMEQAKDEILERAEDSMNEVLAKLDFGACKTKVLVDLGVIDLRKLRAEVVRRMCWALLDKLPKV
jgi:hypothetical protein